MKRSLLISIAIGLCGCAAVQPDRFADGGTPDAQALEKHVEERAARLLGPGERLAVDITALDRAGRTEPWRQGLGNVRVVRDVYPARIDLEFRVTGADGALLKEGKRSLRDLPVADAGVYGNDPLRYERALLDEWLERELRR